MIIFPIVMCGGAGTRLWPASRPSRPKQFFPLSGNRSLFQETVLRVAPLARPGGRLIVVGGALHRPLILKQLEEIEVEACVLLEPESRDSAPAIAAATAHVMAIEPDAILALIASDHHVPDHEAFRTAIRTAAKEAAKGRLVTLGIKPTTPSTSYGYIRPTNPGMAAVEAFLEKPDSTRAAECIAQGYLWNSGNFIVSARVLTDELIQYAPAVHASAVGSIPDQDGRVLHLTENFASAPRVSIDYAVMEKTRRASVLEVDFKWSDLGSWDAVAATGEGSVGLSILEDAENNVVRAPDGVLVAVMGVRNLAIVVERDAVLVSDLSQSVNLKRLVERIRVTSPRHLDLPLAARPSLESQAKYFSRWLNLQALPLWATVGVSETGAFAETISLDGVALTSFRRARVQARQIYVYAQAGILGWSGPWRSTVKKGLSELDRSFRRPDGMYRARVSAQGDPLDETITLYDQAFVLLALATARMAGVSEIGEKQATLIRDRLIEQSLASGGLREAGEHPYQANAHMHLFEAFQAWEDVSDDIGWRLASDQIARLVSDVLFDDLSGCLREFFDANWQPAAGEDGQLVEPGHQFEWASLLFTYALKRGDDHFQQIARRLYAFGRRGIAEQGGYVIDALNGDGSVRSKHARLWPQTEWLRSALLLSEHCHDGDRQGLLADAAAAQSRVLEYLTLDGLWNDKQVQPGDFLEEPAPASSFYHIMSAFRQLVLTSEARGFEGEARLRLG